MTKSKLYGLATNGFCCGVFLMSMILTSKESGFGHAFFIKAVLFIFFLCNIIYTIENNTKKLEK